MSVHFKNTCFKVDKIECSVITETKRNKTQPRIVVQGFAKEVVIKDRVAYIK